MTSAVVPNRKNKSALGAPATGSAGPRTTMRGLADFKCASHARTATSGVLADRGRGPPSAIHRAAFRPYQWGEGESKGGPFPISGGSNGNFFREGGGVSAIFEKQPRQMSWRHCVWVQGLRNGAGRQDVLHRIDDGLHRQRRQDDS